MGDLGERCGEPSGESRLKEGRRPALKRTPCRALIRLTNLEHDLVGEITIRALGGRLRRDRSRRFAKEEVGGVRVRAVLDLGGGRRGGVGGVVEAWM